MRGPVVVLWLATVGLQAIPAVAQEAEVTRLRPVRDAYLLRGANLIDGRGGPVQRDVSVLVYNGLVQAVGHADRMLIPEGTTVVELEGKFVLPGFIDVHAYATDATVVRGLLAHGVTTILNPSAARGAGDVNDLDVGDLPGPQILTAGPAIDAPPGGLPGSTVVRTEEEMRSEVRRQAEEDFDLIKLHRGLAPELVRAAVLEAREFDLPVMAELGETSWIYGARVGVDLLTRLVSPHPETLPEGAREGFAAAVRSGSVDPSLAWLERLDPGGKAVDALVGALLSRDVAVAPLLAASESDLFCSEPSYREMVRDAGRGLEGWTAPSCPDVPRSAEYRRRVRDVWPKALNVVRLFEQEGIRLLAGSNVPFSGMPPGSGFLRELELLAQAGIDPLEVIQIATSNAAVALGILHEVGTLESGKRADLIILRADPLADIRALRTIEFVMLDGEVFAPERADEE